MRCDVLVVGAGPAGSTAARFAALEGAQVVVVEKRPVVGIPVQCAEHVPLPTLDYLPRPAEVVVQRIGAMRTHLDGQVHRLAAPGAIVRRDAFDQQLAESARAAGAHFRLGTAAVAIEDGVVTVEGPSGRSSLRPRVIVGADGPHSRVRRWLGLGAQPTVHAVQWRLPLLRPLATTECHLRRDLPGGYALAPRPLPALRRFVAELVAAGWVGAHIEARTAGPIPVGGMGPLRVGKTLLVGDAAGQCHPITGSGIPNAVVCGELAGRAAGAAVVADDPDLLDAYVEEATDLVGPSLAAGVARRRLQVPTWASPERWRQHAARCWPAFPAYHEPDHAIAR